MPAHLKVLTLNVRGLGPPHKHDLILHELEKLRFDLIFLQETHVSCAAQADKIQRKWKGKILWSFGTVRSAGVAILFSPNFSGKISKFIQDTEGRIISALVTTHSTTFNLLNIYAPNDASARKTFFDSLHSYFLCQNNQIIGGDFNLIESELDRLRPGADFAADRRLMSAFRADLRLVDVWRKNNPRGKSYTWAKKDLSQASRIDKFFIPRSLLRHVNSCSVFPCVLSDHDFLSLTISTDNIAPRRSFIWRLNTAFLSDPEFVRTVNSFIESHKLRTGSYGSLGDWWEDLKTNIRNISLTFAARRRSSVNSERNLLTKRLIRAKRAAQLGDVESSSLVTELERSLHALISKESEGAKIRARAKWVEQGEKPTRYFFRLERARADKNSFESLFDEHGVEKSTPDELETILADFYTSLYSKDNVNLQVQQRLINDLDRFLSSPERDACERPLSASELLTAAQGLQTGKSPGSDGLPVEFYLTFWDVLAEPLLSVLNEALAAGSLTASQRESLVRLIYKKDDKRLPKNWRPISLLNTDYKLASKVMTERLKTVMNSIVHEDQTCGVVGRTIFSNLHLVRDALDMIAVTGEPAILVSLDQEKAFDRVDHDFLLNVLSKFGFGPNFRRWVRLFYTNVFSRVICNGNLTRPIFLGRGVRQGCPLSPLLYVLVSEVLSTQIRLNKEIEGFLLPGAGGLQFKISQYADDATSLLKSERSLRFLLDAVRQYELASGAKLNTSKTNAMWLGGWQCNTATPFGLDWVSKIKILGVYFSNGLVDVDVDNWRTKLDKLSSVLDRWKQRDLSFIGRAMILNTLGLSRLWHVSKVLSAPTWVSDSLKKIIWPFIWKGKMECVSRQRCCAPLSLGGLNIADFNVKCASLLLSNFLSLRDNFGTEKWHYFARYNIGSRLRLLDARFNFVSALVPMALGSLSIDDE